MSKLDDDLAEIEAFVEDLRFSSAIATSDHNRSLFRSAYKQFHALLIWGIVAEARPAGSLPVKTYFREALSDISHAFVLTLLNLYKPARASLRGGVENMVRLLLLMRGIDSTQINSVHELFKAARRQFSSEAVMLKRVQQLDEVYGELCKTVHSTKVDYMSLTVPFEELCVFQNSRYGANIGGLRKVSSAANQAVFWLWHGELRKAGHLNEDLVRDAIPRALKRAAGQHL